MLKMIKRFALWLAITLYGAPQVLPVLAPSMVGAVAAVTAPAVTPVALIGATAIVASIAEDADAATWYALNFNAQNEAANSDVRLVWSGANLLPRYSHTAIWRYSPVQQTGYYALAWHSPNTGSWDYGDYSFGTHPYPVTTCSVDGDGEQTAGAGSGGTVHCWEIAGTAITDGASPHDWLASSGGSALQVTKGPWYVQVRRVRLMTSGPHNGEYEHRYIPDLLGNPSFEIVQYTTFVGDAGSTPAFYFGGSDWSADCCGSGTNNETPSGRLRGIQLYSTYLSDADVATEAANQTSNTPLTAAGIANVWYMNQNPRPTAITDQSGAGHTPSWANANRPAEWDSTVADAAGGCGYRALLGVGCK